MYYPSLNPEFLADLGQAMKWQYFAELATAFSLFFTRISICLFLMRIFGAIPYWRRILYCAIAFMTLTTIPFIILIMIQCTPMRKTWNPSVHGKCLSSAVVNFAGYYNGRKLSRRPTHSKLNTRQWLHWSVTGYLQVCRSCVCGRSKCGQDSRQVFACWWRWVSCESR